MDILINFIVQFGTVFFIGVALTLGVWVGLVIIVNIVFTVVK